MHFTQEQVVSHTKAPQYMHCARTACSTPSTLKLIARRDEGCQKNGRNTVKKG